MKRFLPLTKVIEIALSHENLTAQEVMETIEYYEEHFRLPTTDVLNYGCEKLVQMLGNHFPQLKQKINLQIVERIPVVAKR